MKTFLMFSRSMSIAQGDSGIVLWVKLYWFLHATRQVAMIIPAKVALLKGTFPFSMEATADVLSLSIGIIPMYPLRTSIWLRCWRAVILCGFFLKLLII